MGPVWQWLHFQTVVVPCAANSALYKCKGGGIVCGFVWCCMLGEKKHKMIKLSKHKDQILQWEVLPISLSHECKHYCYPKNGYIQLELLFHVRGVLAPQRKCRSLLRWVKRRGWLAGLPSSPCWSPLLVKTVALWKSFSASLCFYQISLQFSHVQ